MLLFIYFTNLARLLVDRSHNLIMPRQLSSSQRSLIASMIEAGLFSNFEIATIVHTTDRTIRRFGEFAATYGSSGKRQELRARLVK